MLKSLLRTSAILSLLTALTAAAQQSERFDNYELHYSALNSTFISAEVAATYGITRGDRYGMVNIALRRHNEDGTAQTLPMTVKARTWDLISEQPLVLKPVREGDATYYIGEFKFINREWRFFEFDFTPEGSEKTYNFTFRRQMYIN